MISLERRLRHSLAISLLLLMAILWLGGSWAISKMTREFVASRLEHDAEALLASVKRGEKGVAPDTGTILPPTFQRPFSGHYYLIRSGDADYRSRSLWDWPLKIEPVATGESRLFERQGPDGQLLLIWSGGYRKMEQEFTIAVAEDLNPVRYWRSMFQWTFALSGLAGLIALLIVQRQVLRQGFLPLDKVRRDIRALERGETGSLNEEVPVEVRPMVVEINALLAHLSRKISRSRNAVGNLAHALKGPLNLLFQSLSAREPLRPEELRGHVDEIHRLMERELRRAKLAGGAVPGAQFSPCDELPLLIRVLERLYGDACPRFELLCPGGLQLPLDREDMMEALGNLMDNACKWARGRVAVRLDADDSFRLVVEDDGPGVSPSQLKSLAGRGVRLDESVDGHGLGLSIVKELVELYRGRLGFDCDGSLGGLRVTVELPLSRLDAVQADEPL